MSNALATMGGMQMGAVMRPQNLSPAVQSQRRAGDRIENLSREQKAAIIIRLLATDSGALPIKGFTSDTMVRLLHAMAGLRFVDEQTTLVVVKEFLSEIDSLALYFKSGLAGAIATLDAYLSPEVREILSASPDPEAPHDPWFLIAGLEAHDLARILAHETPQVCGIVLSKLSASKAAGVLGELDPDLARAATLAAVRIGRVEHDTIHNIGTAIEHAATKLKAKGALTGTPIDRVGAFLNFAPGQSREDMLKNLDAEVPDLAEQVRRVMFTFADIPDRVEIKDVPKLVRAVDNATLVTALAGALISHKGIVDFILENMSKRLSEQLAEEIKELGEVKPKEADIAMNAVVQGIRQLESEGELVLISQEE